jgi:hypothetical protein
MSELTEQLDDAFRQVQAAKGQPVSLSGSGKGFKWSLQIGSFMMTEVKGKRRPATRVHKPATCQAIKGRGKCTCK